MISIVLLPSTHFEAIIRYSIFEPITSNHPELTNKKKDLKRKIPSSVVSSRNPQSPFKMYFIHTCILFSSTIMIKVKVEFLGGLDVISNHVREHKVTLPFEEGEATMKDLISHVTDTVICDAKDIPVFIEDGTVRPGILVLINDTDWELEGMEDYEVESGDVFTFTSTLHGG